MQSLVTTAADPAYWDALVTHAERVFTAPGFNERELNPTLDLAEDLRRARGAALSRVKRHTWRAHLERALGAAGLTDGQVFLTWCTERPDDAREALRALWGDLGLSPVDHLALFLHTVPTQVARDLDSRLTLATLLLSAVDPTRYPAYEPGLAGNDTTGDDPAAAYRSALEHYDRLIAEAARRGLPLRHRLHAAAVLRCIARQRAPRAPLGGPVRLHERRAPYGSLAALAAELLLDEPELAKIVTLLEDRGQAVFYGPPGTGKTFVARALARHLAAGDDHVQVVQFHPSSAYEDFVEGYRPSSAAGKSAFALVDGPLKRFAEQARQDPSHRYVLVIDELNRANVAKVFGELYYLLEYRDDSVQLQYSQVPFSLPRNLLVIATMNAADRSIALVDLALRRRFYFVPFFPDTPPVEGLLRRWLSAHRPQLLWVADAVDRANAALSAQHDRHAAIGPSHFMRPDLSEEWVELIWEHAVLPTIAEQLFGDEAALQEFRLDRLRAGAAYGTRPKQPKRTGRKGDAPADAR
ncbi:MAG TPA: AAA family ATPase [Chloroflexota bacterium]|nr:AAA family ATPase [Chloroflexota bacterium]